MLFGLFIILIGGLILLKNLGIITTSLWNIIYPSAIILIGLGIIFRPKSKFWNKKEDN